MFTQNALDIPQRHTNGIIMKLGEAAQWLEHADQFPTCGRTLLDDVVSLLRVSASVSYMDRRHLHGPAGLLGKHDIILTILVVEHSQREGHLHVLQLEFLSVFSRLPEIQGGVRDALSPSITIRNVRNVKSTPMCWSLDRPNVQTFIQLDFTNIVKEYSSVSLNGPGAHITWCSRRCPIFTRLINQLRCILHLNMHIA